MIADGQVIKVFWRGKTIYVNHHQADRGGENVDVASCPIRSRFRKGQARP